MKRWLGVDGREEPIKLVWDVQEVVMKTYRSRAQDRAQL